jgi:hypothetical protein
VPQNFVWQAASAGNNTANPSANLALLFGAGTMPPAETGLSIDPSGVITFAPGQTFPFADSGSGGGGTSSTITAVTAGSGLTGGGSAGNVTIALAGPISTANGGTGASTPAGALASMGFGGTFYANNYNSFSAALSAASGGTLVITSLVSITTSTTIPSNVAISVAQGGGISVNSGQTLKINGRFQAGLYQVFTGSGTVSFGPNTITDAYAGWWYGGSGAWDFSINSCIAAASAIATWCDLPATVNTINTITVPSNTWLRPVSQNGAGYFFGLGYGTVWTHSPTISGAATISTVGGSTITYSTRIEGILFASTNSGGHYPEAAIYLSYDIGCRLKGIGSSSTYTLATILVSALMNCKMDELGINGILSSPNPAGLRFLGDKSTPIGSISTTVDITHLSMDGGDVAGVVFDGDACLGCNFYSPSIETLAQNAFNIGKGNQVDLYSPYVENVPRTDSAFGIFRIGQDYSTALGGTSVNIFGGNVAGTNITNPVNPLAFDLGPYMGSVALHGGTYWQINNFQNISSACTNCVLHINNVSAYATMGFGTVTAANSNQIDFPAGNVFGCAAYYINGADCGPAVSQQFGLAVNAPGYPRVSPGQLFYSTDKGLLVWNNSLPTPAWQSAAQGLNSVLSSASPNLNPPEALSPAGAHASAAISAPELTVHNKCFSTASPAVCGISASGTVQIAANARKLVVYTSNVAADSVILYSYQIAASGCTTAPTNIASLLAPYTSAVTPGTSFTIALPIAPIKNVVCVQFVIL